MSRYILALDQGTTSSRAMLFDESARVVASAQKEIAQFYPREGWVEHDATEIYSSCAAVMAEAVASSGIDEKDIASIGITNQRETTVVWNRRTGLPVYHAIVWQCRRTAGIVEELRAEGLGPYIKSVTGLIPDAYFSGPKVKWILDNVPGAKDAARRGELLFGTVDSWLIWKLTDGAVHATDLTNASRTMLFDIRARDWDARLLERLDIPRSMLPRVLASDGDFGYAELGGARIPIHGVAGDQQAALFGQGCFTAGEAKNTYGTGCFLLMNTGDRALTEAEGLLATVAASRGDNISYALEGSVFTGGALIQWLRDGLGIISDSADTEAVARTVSDNGGVYIVPALTGLGAPHWDMYARGTILGLTRGCGKGHIVRAAEEAIAYQVYDVVEAVEKASGCRISRLKADGGATRDSLLMQFQSDILARPVEKVAMSESTALGAAMLAGLGCGLWESGESVRALIGDGREFVPHMLSETRLALLGGWRKALERSFGWCKP